VFNGYRGFPIRLQNFVSTIDLRCSLDLQAIQHKVRNAEYNPQKFAACVIRIRKPRCTALVFESGKMVVTGAGCHEDSKLAATKFASTVSVFAGFLSKIFFFWKRTIDFLVFLVFLVFRVLLPFCFLFFRLKNWVSV
jgi:hypothetical protein